MKGNYVAVRDMFESEDTVNMLKKVLPSMVTADRLVRVALTVIRTNDKLMTCSRDSLLACLIGCGQLGLSPDPFLGQAYLVPFWSSKLNSYEATLIPGYKGLITLARRSGHVADVVAQIVYWNDEFRAVMGLNPDLYHVENEKDPGDFRGAWAMFRYQTPGWQPTWQYLSKAKIDRHMKMSKSKTKDGVIFGPWVDHYDAMALKTAVRVTSKFVPMSIEDKFEKAIQAEDMALAGLGQSSVFLPPGHGALTVRDLDEEIRELTRGWKGREHISEFISVAAAQSDKSPEELKKLVLSGDVGLLKNFQEGFDLYLASADPAGGSAPGKAPGDGDAGSGTGKVKDQSLPPAGLAGVDWQGWRKEWINKRNVEIFKHYFETNLGTLYTCPVPDLVAEFDRKFHDMTGLDLPPDRESAEAMIAAKYQLQTPEPGRDNAQPDTSVGDTGKTEIVEHDRAQAVTEHLLDNIILALKEKHPRVWITELKGKKPTDLESKIEAVVRVAAFIDLDDGTELSKGIARVIRYSLSQ